MTAVAAVALSGALAVTGCASGYNAATARQKPTINGISAAKADLAIRNAYAGGPVDASGSAPVSFAVFNGGNNPDRLVAISSPAADGGTVPSNAQLPPGGQLFFNPGGDVPRLTGLRDKLRPGQLLQLTLSFQRTGDITLQVAVEELPADQLSSPSASSSPSPSGSASPSSSASPSGSASPSASASPSP